MFYRSERLFLRPAWPEDATAIYRGIGDQEVVCNLAMAPWPYRVEDAHAFLARPQEDGLPRFAITLPGQTGDLVGMVGLNEREDGIELGYWIARKCWGRGVATEAVRGILEVAASMGVGRINAGHFCDNPASGKVLRKAGFVSTGEIRPQFSLARGHNSPSLRYALELDSGGEPDMQRAA